MAVFDGYIKSVLDFARALPAGGSAGEEYSCRETPEQIRAELPIRVGRGANPGIIMRGDTFVELGNPAQGSCSHLLWTDSPSLIEDGRIRLIGPDICESGGQSLPFGQVLILAGEGLRPADHERLQRVPIVGDQIEGYMVRSTSDHLWSRVSRDAATRGFDFEMLGRALIALAKEGAPGVTAMEVLFVTSSSQDVKQLGDVASEVKAVGSELLKEEWKARGYDVDCDFDCASCHDEEVCDDIREVLVDVNQKKREKKAADRAAEQKSWQPVDEP